VVQGSELCGVAQAAEGGEVVTKHLKEQIWVTMLKH
jgi:hypothetical protein